MAAPKKNSSVITARAKGTTALVPGLLGFSSLTEPDTYDPEKPCFKANVHYTPAGIQALASQLAAQCMGKAMDDLKAEAEESKFKLGDLMPIDRWLESALKEAKEGAWTDLPHIQVKNSSTYKNRTGEIIEREIVIWSGSPGPGYNKKLQLRRLRLGRGSTIEPVVNVNLYASKLNGDIRPSLKLVGLRLLKLVQFGQGQQEAAETDEARIREVMGSDFEADDMSAFLDMGPEEDEVAAPPVDAEGTVDKVF